jgi:hypothetical protein
MVVSMLRFAAPWRRLAMQAHALIRQFLELCTAHEPPPGRICSCGDVTPVQFREASNAQRAEAFADAELDELCLETELGCASLLENPFGGDVYLDEGLLLYPHLVVCPKTFSGPAGECYRISTRDLMDGGDLRARR